MPEIILTIEHEAGLHARPAGLFVQTAKQFQSSIFVSLNGNRVDAKSILSVLTLGACQGSEITICAEGEDANQALNTLQTLVEDNFGE
jgi:phosphocarrier protein